MTKLIITATAVGLGLWWYSKQNQTNEDQTIDQPSSDNTSVIDEIMNTITSAPATIADKVKLATGNAQTLSEAGLELLKKTEGFSATPYPDHKGFSVGYGHLIKSGESLSMVTKDEAEQLLLGDVQWAEQAVRTSVNVPLNSNQFDALVSLAYNIGQGAFKSSTLVKKLNAGDYEGAADQFALWNKASGAINSALVSRRAQEADLFNTEATA